MTIKTVKAVQYAQEAGIIVRRLVNKKRKKLGLGPVEVYSRPVNGHGTMIEFVFTFDAAMSCKQSEDDCRRILKEMLKDEFCTEGAHILKSLGWKKFTVKRPSLNARKCSISIEKAG